MVSRHLELSRKDGLYWATILAACIGGETCADFLSHGPLGLGYGLASIVLLTGVVLALAAELTARTSNETRYWTTIVAMATAGTTMADFLSRTLELGYLRGTSLLAVLFVSTLLVWRGRPLLLGDRSWLPRIDIRNDRRDGWGAATTILPHANIHGQDDHLSTTDAGYWLAIMVASTLGTTTGDALTNGTDLGFGGGAMLLTGVLLFVLLIESRAKAPNEARYWSALLLCSTIGAATGDFITHEEGLDWGYHAGSAFVIGLFLAILLIGHARRALHSLHRRIERFEHTADSLVPALHRIAEQLDQDRHAPPPPQPQAVRPIPASARAASPATARGPRSPGAPAQHQPVPPAVGSQPPSDRARTPPPRPRQQGAT